MLTGLALWVLSGDIATLIQASVIRFYIPIPTESFEPAVRFTAAILLVTGISIGSNRYLRFGFRPLKADKDDVLDISEKHLLSEIDSRLEQQELHIRELISSSSLSSSSISSEERKGITENLSAVIEKNLSGAVLNSIEAKYGTEIRQSAFYETISDEYKGARSRLISETENLNRRGNLNLIIGIFITLIGIFFLGWSVISAPNLESSDRDLLAYYFPRTTFVILINIFAFFFLNLYRTSLNEIKYFQNELTNLEAKMIAIETMLLMEDKESLAKISFELVKSERNFILRRGQTTIELEKEKMGNNFLKENLTVIGDFLRDQDRKSKS